MFANVPGINNHHDDNNEPLEDPNTRGDNQAPVYQRNHPSQQQFVPIGDSFRQYQQYQAIDRLLQEQHRIRLKIYLTS
jgi:hypothetical protein